MAPWIIPTRLLNFFLAHAVRKRAEIGLKIRLRVDLFSSKLVESKSSPVTVSVCFLLGESLSAKRLLLVVS